MARATPTATDIASPAAITPPDPNVETPFFRLYLSWNCSTFFPIKNCSNAFDEFLDDQKVRDALAAKSAESRRGRLGTESLPTNSFACARWRGRL